MYIVKDCKRTCCIHYFGTCKSNREADLYENEIRCKNYEDVYNVEREIVK